MSAHLLPRSGVRWLDSLLIVLAAGLTVSACERALVEPATGRAALLTVSYSLVSAAGMPGGPAEAFDKADGARILISHTGALIDTVVAFSASAGEVRLRFELELQSERDSAFINIELRRAAEPLFTGASSVELRRGETTPSHIELRGVPATIRVTPPDTMTALGDTTVLRAAALFATDDTIPGISAQFTPVNPGVVALTADGAALVAIAEGRSWVRAVYGAARDSVEVVVAPQVASVLVTPDSAAIGPGGHVQLTATPRDRRGNALARPVTWSSPDTTVAVVDSAGRVTGVAGGMLSVTASSMARTGRTALAVEDPTFEPHVSVGATHACALAVTGLAYCWGHNQTGQLGNGSTADATTAAPVAGGHRFRLIGAGDSFSCGLTVRGRVLCWGSGFRTGSGITTTAPNPREVAGDYNFRALAVGRFHTCAITTRGDTYCWGSNTYGGLGNGTSGSSAFEPVKVSTTVRFTALAVGAFFTCGRTQEGDAWCWGLNSSGQLGDSTGTNHSTPVRAREGTRFEHISAGYSTACGIEQGVGTCWGYAPVAESALRSEGVAFSMIAMGISHGCGISTDGEVHCWGFNAEAQAGTAPDITRYLSAPTRVSGISGATSISSGFTTTCAMAGGSVWCWGEYQRGVLGAGLISDELAPREVVGIGGLVVSAGLGHNCALAASGSALCWGRGYSGELGDATYGLQNVPSSVATGVTFTQLSAGWNSTCGVASDGAGWCWGLTFHSSSGDTIRWSGFTTPAAVPDNMSFSHIAVGYAHACGITPDRAVYCWGHNRYGQLGDGSLAWTTSPVRVASDKQFRTVTVGQLHSCAVTTDGEVHCWGRNAFGQLGDGSTSDAARPVHVASLADVADVVAGAISTCALTADGDAYCWGGNNFGVLGSGTTASTTTPIAVAGGHRFRMLSAQGYTTCGVSLDGAVYCWGNNSNGQLGTGSHMPASQPQPVRVAALPPASSVAVGYSHACATTAVSTYCWGRNTYGTIGIGEYGFTAAPVRVQGM
jgi:alpha-tubulin suppressor-like RCC1 family protein